MQPLESNLFIREGAHEQPLEVAQLLDLYAMVSAGYRELVGLTPPLCGPSGSTGEDTDLLVGQPQIVPHPPDELSGGLCLETGCGGWQETPPMVTT